MFCLSCPVLLKLNRTDERLFWKGFSESSFSAEGIWKHLPYFNMENMDIYIYIHMYACMCVYCLNINNMQSESILGICLTATDYAAHNHSLLKSTK